jgi:peptidoglycan/LPS O-acetylase OafA/YrhL
VTGQTLAVEPREGVATPGAKPGARFTQLDSLRAFAVFAVIVSHTGPHGLDPYALGMRGVQLFFVLSGFLITGILLAAGHATTSRRRTLGAFYGRRFLRIFPAYYSVLLITVLIGIPEVRHGIAWHAAYLSNVRAARLGFWEGPVSHLWSLSVEEQFYLCWPLLVLCVPRIALPTVLAGAVLVGPLTRYALFISTGNVVTTLVLMPSNLDPLALGAGLALVWDRAGAAARRYMGWIALLSGGMLWIASMHVPAAFGIALGPLATSLVFVWLVHGAAMGFGGLTKRLLEWRPLVYLGTISYGMYLYHNFVAAGIWRAQQATNVWLRLPPRGFGLVVYVSVITVLLASASWRVLERPLNDLKVHFRYN